MTENYTIRAITVTDCRSLTALALNSTSFWGYTVDYLRTCVEHFMITEETLKNWTGSLLENDRSIIGFYFLSTSPPDAELERLYVAHQLIGQGNGRRLFHIAAQTALDRNCRTIRIEADVNAVPFYERMGAIQTGCYFLDIDARYKLAELEYHLA